MDEIVQQIALPLRLGDGLSNNDQRAGQYFKVIGIAPKRCRAVFDIGIETSCLFDRPTGGENHFGSLGCNLSSSL